MIARRVAQHSPETVGGEKQGREADVFTRVGASKGGWKR